MYVENIISIIPAGEKDHVGVKGRLKKVVCYALVKMVSHDDPEETLNEVIPMIKYDNDLGIYIVTDKNYELIYID